MIVETAAQAHPARRTRILRVVLASSYALCACLIVAWGLNLVMAGGAMTGTSAAPLALAAILLVVAAPRVFRPPPDLGPLRSLQTIVEGIRKGERPIEELSSVEGELSALAGLIGDLSRELRQQKAEIQHLEEEMHQRIAQRTDALERMVGTLRQQATRDALTGLFNRRFLDTYLPQAMQRCRANRSDMAVLMMDLDHFKQLNDTCGHAAGDQLLRAVGQIIRSGVRGEDVPFRYGGDEFLILLPGCGPQQGQALADRLVRLVDGLTRGLRVQNQPRLCVGVTHLADDDVQPQDLIRRADAALYEEKRQRQSLRIPLQNPVAPLQSAALNR